MILNIWPTVELVLTLLLLNYEASQSLRRTLYSAYRFELVKPLTSYT